MSLAKVTSYGGENLYTMDKPAELLEFVKIKVEVRKKYAIIMLL